MKRLCCCFCSLLLLLTLLIPAYAVDHEQTYNQIVLSQTTEFVNGFTIIDEIIDCTTSRSSDKTYERKQTITHSGTTIAVIAIRGTFRYDGTTVSVVSKSVTQTDTYEGWSYKQNSFTSSGGTITLDAKLTKLLVMNIPFTMTLSCDKNGNISYT